MAVDQLTTFLGWSSLINIALLVFSTLTLVAFQKPISRLHGTLFRLDDQNLAQAYFKYLAQFKILIIIFNLTPYIALRLMM
ncbi:DUF6868 family protein [Roseibium sp.]|uniref:DUF6868 family protein n=1 Tax=Roseibium sp. TaxID=1936156 RepID=UPI003A976E36